MFGDPDTWPTQDLVGISPRLSVDMAVAGYASGVFPMPGHGEIHWFSPVARGVLPLYGLRVPRSLRKSCRRYVATVDADFPGVLERCADPAREYGWIDADVTEVYTALHRLGLAHSVECWTPDGELAGGLYGVALGGLFAGESMFHDAEVGRDASKVALVHLVGVLRAAGDAAARLLDVQWQTSHLASLGVQETPRPRYLRRLGRALDCPAPDWARVAADGPRAVDPDAALAVAPSQRGG